MDRSCSIRSKSNRFILPTLRQSLLNFLTVGKDITMQIEKLITRFSKARPTALNNWIACCPAHDDKQPSLAIKDAGNGMILLHCFAGCSLSDICSALNIEISDLMPDQVVGHHFRRQLFDPVTVLESLSEKATIFAIYASDVASGKQLTPEEKQKIFDISVLFNQAVAYASQSQAIGYRGKYRVMKERSDES